jgi:hypothetical protein
MKSFLILGLSMVLLSSSSAQVETHPQAEETCEALTTGVTADGRKVQNCWAKWEPVWKIKAMKLTLTPEQTAMIHEDAGAPGHLLFPNCPKGWTFFVMKGYWKVGEVTDKKPSNAPYCWRPTPTGWVEPVPEEDAPAGDEQRRNRN